MKHRFLALWLGIAAGAVCADSVELQDRLQLADGLFRRSLFDLAAKEYAAIAEMPNLQGLDNVLFRLAECQRRQKQNEAAAATYAKLIEKFPDSTHIHRARLQAALLADAAKATGLLEPLTAEDIPADVRQAALYHLGQAYDQSGRSADALACFLKLAQAYPDSEYAFYCGLKTAWLLSKTGKPEQRRQAMGMYLELFHQKKDDRVAEEAIYFAAMLAMEDERYEESAKLFKSLQTRFPNSAKLAASTLSAAWANYYAGQFQSAVNLLDGVLKNKDAAARDEMLYLRANSLRQLAKSEEAVAAYRQLIAEYPESGRVPAAWFEAVCTLYSAGKYPEVLKLAGERVPDAKDADRLYWMCAEAALDTGKTDEGIHYCKTLVEKCPQSQFAKNALYRLGWLLNKQEAWESAASWYRQVVQKFPNDPLAPKALYSAGLCHSRLGQRETALKDWTDLLTRYPDCEEAAETLYQKAMEEVRGKDYRAAGATLDERIRRFPKADRQADVLYWRALVYRQLDDAAEAEKNFRACLAANPSKELERESQLYLGVILHERGKEQDAAAMFLKLLDSPISEKIGEERLAWLSSFLFEQKQLDGAAKAAKILIDLKPDKGWQQAGWTLAGRVYREKGERDAAIGAFEKAVQTGANTTYAAEASLRLGELLSDSGKFDAAAEHLENAAKLAAAPEKTALRARAYLALAQNAERQGKDEAALRYYMSVGLLFDNAELVPKALRKAAELLDKLGRKEDAERTREELKTRYPDAAAFRSNTDANATAMLRSDRTQESGSGSRSVLAGASNERGV
ncbi:MAG: tetratricopeptide repeat protein [Kiritimatiellae bacterium]|nr:tetratricopeptide repeat protein [Kiritimatiellia bacterium]